VSVIALTRPRSRAFVASKTSEAQQAGLPMPRMLAIAEQVRLFVIDLDAPPLPATVGGRPGFDTAAGLSPQ